jgi:hypothetical protein
MRLISSLALGLFILGGSHARGADANAPPTCINMTCPISGKPVDSSIAMVPFAAKNAPAGSLVGFCCPKCQATYDKDPAKCEAGLSKQLNDKAQK